MNADNTDPTRREELLFMLLHSGAQSESIAKRIVDLVVAEAQAEPTPELSLLRAESSELDDLRRLVLPKLHREIEHHKDGKARWRGRAEKAEQELRDRVAELETVKTKGRKLVAGWLKSSADHHFVSHLDTVKTDPLMAGMQNGRANQYSDCANELQDVLNGEDPDGWEWGVTVTSSQTCTRCNDSGIDPEDSDPGSGPTEHSMGEPLALEPCRNCGPGATTT